MGDRGVLHAVKCLEEFFPSPEAAGPMACAAFQLSLTAHLRHPVERRWQNDQHERDPCSDLQVPGREQGAIHRRRLELRMECRVERAAHRRNPIGHRLPPVAAGESRRSSYEFRPNAPTGNNSALS